uniref:Uncharacterized protein n=1 Tax=Ciona intestinalis TaxID=7719 RepID=F6U5S8_CIOIN
MQVRKFKFKLIGTRRFPDLSGRNHKKQVV